MQKDAHAAYSIHPLLRQRWSPRAFDGRPIEPALLRSLFEAARWAPSCFNVQPWRFVIATGKDPEAFQRILSCLSEANRPWAAKAGMLVVAVAKSTFDHNESPNRHAWHDVGLAVAQLTVQATHQGLAVHQMAGFKGARVRDELSIPDGFDPVTVIAIGYPTEAATLPEDLRIRERAERSRRPQQEFVFDGSWRESLVFEEELEPERVLSFWFGQVDEQGLSSSETSARWWKKDPAFDTRIREVFAHEHAAILRGERDGWLVSARGRLAYIIVLDQFSRNIFRDTPGMFSHDELALRAALEGIELGMDRAVKGDLRAFYYLPLMHSENIEDQHKCVELFQELVRSTDASHRDRFENNLKFAQTHRDIVAKWGRFPHRNLILGRESSQEEQAFLQQPGSSF